MINVFKIYSIIFTSLVVIGTIVVIIFRKKIFTKSCPSCPSCNSCCNCASCSSCCSLPFKNPVLIGYYTPYQDPYCQSGLTCPKTGVSCTKSLLSDPNILKSKLDIIIMNPVAPDENLGVTVAYTLQSFYNNGIIPSCNPQNCKDPKGDKIPSLPLAIKQGIADLHKAGKKILVSFLPGTGENTWGNLPAFWKAFASACQYMLTEWDIDGFDWDCEEGECPPVNFGSGQDWNNPKVQKQVEQIFTTLRSLKCNKNRGFPGESRPIITWTGETTWQFSGLTDISPYTPLIDYFCTMNENYSIQDPQQMLKDYKSFQGKGMPIEKIVCGVKAGGCLESSGGYSVDIFNKITSDQSLNKVVAGYSLWNICRDAGCLLGQDNNTTTGSCKCKSSGITTYPGCAQGQNFSLSSFSFIKHMNTLK
jgi:hypothetical protein